MPVCKPIERARMWLCCALFSSAAAQAASTPELTLMGMRDALVRNDLKALVHQAVPPTELAREKQRASARKQRPVDPERQEFKRKQFDESYGRLLVPDAARLLMVEIEPRLAEMRLPMMAGQVMFFVEASKALQKEKKFTEQQKAELQALLNALQMYLARTDVLSSDRLQKALQEIVLAARAAGVVSFEQMEQLDFDDALTRFSVFATAGKLALRHYDLDANAVLRSMRFRNLKQTPEMAEVEVELTVLDVTVHFPLELHAHEQGWYLQRPPVQAKDEVALAEEVDTATAEHTD